MTDALPLASRPVLVVDFGAQYAQLIARRVREANVYSEVVPHTMPAAEMLGQGPGRGHPVRRPVVASTRRARPRSTAALLEAGVPVLGICYGFQAMAQALGGTVAQTGLREYGATTVASVDRRRVDPVRRPAGDAVGLDEPRRLGRRRRPAACG